MEEKESFCKQMRTSTRDVHALSDHLVNLKLALALYDNEVWAEGLLIFYEIFRWLEENVSLFHESLLPEEILRTKAFEDDLTYYLGPDWKSSKKYQPREEVAQYLRHLEQLKRDNSVLLLAYVYHLYMGLLSGGQILQKKRKMMSQGGQGMAVTNIENYSISELKSKIREIFEEKAASEWSNEIKEQILEEGRKVFELNNMIVASVKNATKVHLKHLGYLVLIILVILVSYTMWNV